MAGKSAEAFRTISEVSDDLGVPQHVLRFWEGKFPQVSPLKRGGNRRYYRPDDVALLRAINKLLYTDGLTIRGVQKLLAERGVRAVIAEVGERSEEPLPVPAAADLFAPEQPAEPPALSSEQMAELRRVRDLLAAALERAA